MACGQVGAPSGILKLWVYPYTPAALATRRHMFCTGNVSWLSWQLVIFCWSKKLDLMNRAKSLYNFDSEFWHILTLPSFQNQTGLWGFGALETRTFSKLEVVSLFSWGHEDTVVQNFLEGWLTWSWTEFMLHGQTTENDAGCKIATIEVKKG